MPPEIPAIDSIRHVHFVAVAGTAMGTLACMLSELGMRVTGSDVAAYPPMSDQLRAAGIQIEKGFAAEHVADKRPDLVIIGNAVRADNLEARAAIDSGLPYLSLPDAVQLFFLGGKHSVAIVGTHGKTTSTSLIGWILTHAKRDPSVLIGGVAANFDGSFRIGGGKHFVIEGDEYDTAFFDKTPKFMHYNARSLLFTSCEFDHADIYDSLDQIKQSFIDLVESIPADGLIVAATDVPAVDDILAVHAQATVEGYGFREAALWKVTDVVASPAETKFTVWRGEERMGLVRSPLHGTHNLENVLGAVALCHGLGVDVEESIAALADFHGEKRRQECRGEAAGMAVIDDFAHHPTAVRETVGAMRARYPDRELWAVFEPRTNTSRRRFFEDEYVDALAGADRVIIGAVYNADQIPDDERMRPEYVASELLSRGVDAIHLAGVDDIVDRLARHRSGNDVALIMSNGEFGGICELLLARLGREER